MPTTDPTRCPLCGGANACAMAKADGDATAGADCWCSGRTIDPAALAAIPEELRMRACLCANCSDGAMDDPNAGVRRVVDPGGRTAFALERGRQRALVSATGAQVLSWHDGDRDVLWTASAPVYEQQKPVRGGVPVVFPWFGDHADGQLPAHGFARSKQWRLAESRPGAIRLELTDDAGTRSVWPHAFHLALDVELTDGGLRLGLAVENSGDAPFRFEEALHTYFAVGDVHTAEVRGLEGVPFTEFAREPEADWDASAPLRFRAETDRVFQQVPDEIRLVAPTLAHEVVLRGRNARSAIVWNPWPNKTRRLSQMHADDWRSFCCIETANVKDGAIELPPGESHRMRLDLSVVRR